MGNVRSSLTVEMALSKKGLIKQLGGDHIYFFMKDVNGKRDVVRTKISHGAKSQTLGMKLISDMARQCHLTKQQFLDFVDCRLSEEAYREILRKNGFDV